MEQSARCKSTAPQAVTLALEEHLGHMGKTQGSTTMMFRKRCEDSKNINQFRITFLLSVEGKIFSVIAKWLADFLLKNHCIDTSVQTGVIPGVPRWLEHTGVITQLLRDAKETRGDLKQQWLDLVNAYGSMPHKLVQETLERHYVLAKVRDLILDNYFNFREFQQGP